MESHDGVENRLFFGRCRGDLEDGSRLKDEHKRVLNTQEGARYETAENEAF